MTFKEFRLISLVNMLGYDNSRWTLDFITRKASANEIYHYDIPEDVFVEGLTLTIWPEDEDEKLFCKRATPTYEHPTKDGILLIYDLNEKFG